MEVVNPFILKNKIGMVKFIDELCNVEYADLMSSNSDDATIDSNNNNGTNGNQGSVSHDYNQQNPAQDLAIVHSVCEKYKSNLEQLATSSQAAKRLVTILTILHQHKQYYLRRNANTSTIQQSSSSLK